jgi:hypothetical protein
VARRMGGECMLPVQPNSTRMDSWSAETSMLIATRWLSRRTAAVAGIVFAVLLIAASVMMRQATVAADLESLTSDPLRRRVIRTSLQLVPFADIAFLWFIGIVRDQLGDVEDRLFTTVFLGSGLLFPAMLLQGVVTATSVLELLANAQIDPGVGDFALSSRT